MGPGSDLTGFSLQTNKTAFSNVHDKVTNYLTRSVNAGKPWAVASTSRATAAALRPDDDAGNSHEDGRKNALWGPHGRWLGQRMVLRLINPHSDLTLNDFRSRDDWWDYARYAA